MKNSSNISKRIQILSVLMVYLFIAVTHIYYLPQTSATTKHCHNSIFKRKIENVSAGNFIQRTAKAVFKQDIKVAVADAPVTYLTFNLTEPETKDQQLKAYLVNTRLINNHRYLYLSHCIFRV